MKDCASCVIAMLLPLALILCLPGTAAAQTAAAEASKSEDEALLKRMEQSGAFDQAVARALQRLQQRQAEARKKAQEDDLARRAEMAKNARPVDSARDHVYGDARATVNIIEYSDFECPFCKRYHGVPEEVVRRMGGKANLVWRHFPLEIHGPLALRAAEASECAAKLGGNDAFWSYANEVMKRTRSNGQGLPATAGDPLVALAVDLKLDAAAFGKCLDSGETRERVNEDFKDGQNSGVTGTPGTVLRNATTGNTLFAEGAISADALEAGVKELLSAEK